jgi:uncharacterized protein YyaL (SSP411 family)
MNLLRLAALTGNDNYRAAAIRTIALYRTTLEQHGPALTRMLAAVGHLQDQVAEVVLVGPDMSALAPFLELCRTWAPSNPAVIAVTPATRAVVAKLTPLLEGRDATVATAWVCRRGACELPVTTPRALAERLTGTTGR